MIEVKPKRNCLNCQHRERGKMLTSYPPKYGCSKTGVARQLDDVCDEFEWAEATFEIGDIVTVVENDTDVQLKRIADALEDLVGLYGRKG